MLWRQLITGWSAFHKYYSFYYNHITDFLFYSSVLQSVTIQYLSFVVALKVLISDYQPWVEPNNRNVKNETSVKTTTFVDYNRVGTLIEKHHTLVALS